MSDPINPEIKIEEVTEKAKPVVAQNVKLNGGKFTLSGGRRR